MLLAEPRPTPPIDTAAKAAAFAVQIVDVRKALSAAQQQANYRSWKTYATRNPEVASQWNVSIRSDGVLPSYSCRVSIDHDGALLSSTCEYAK